MKKTLLACLVILIVAIGCKNEGGDISFPKTLILVASIGYFFYWGFENSKKQKNQADELRINKNSFENDFYRAIEKIESSNCTINGLHFGLCIPDNKEAIAIFSDTRNLKIIPRTKIRSCELQINNTTTINSKSKAPVVTWNTTAKTSGTVINNFKSADLRLTIDDLETPFIKLNFTDLMLAEKYTALINLVMASKDDSF